MKKAYLVTKCEYSDYEIIAVFLCKNEAEKCCDVLNFSRFSVDEFYEYKIEEYEIGDLSNYHRNLYHEDIIIISFYLNSIEFMKKSKDNFDMKHGDITIDLNNFSNIKVAVRSSLGEKKGMKISRDLASKAKYEITRKEFYINNDDIKIDLHYELHEILIGTITCKIRDNLIIKMEVGKWCQNGPTPVHTPSGIMLPIFTPENKFDIFETNDEIKNILYENIDNYKKIIINELRKLK